MSHEQLSALSPSIATTNYLLSDLVVRNPHRTEKGNAQATYVSDTYLCDKSTAIGELFAENHWHEYLYDGYGDCWIWQLPVKLADMVVADHFSSRDIRCVNVLLPDDKFLSGVDISLLSATVEVNNFMCLPKETTIHLVNFKLSFFMPLTSLELLMGDPEVKEEAELSN